MVPVNQSAYERRLAAYEAEMSELREQAKALEEEVIALRRRLQDAPKRVRTLEERLLETKGQLAQAVAQNEKLTYTLREAREHIAVLREEVDKLTRPPSAYGTFLATNDDGTVDVFSGGRKMRVSLHPEIESEELRRGQEVVLNESLNVVLARGTDLTGEVVTLKEVLEDGTRALVVGRADEERVRASSSRISSARSSVRATRCSWTSGPGSSSSDCPDPRSRSWCSRRSPTSRTRTSGGLDEQIEQIADAVELRRFCTRGCFAEYRLPAPKGILLYGPPGCGKTLIAKAETANSLAAKVAETSGDNEARSYFLNIKGPELLNKYVGETERQIRLVFQRAREKSEEGWPVIVFFDEMDSMFRTRGTGISSDIESTIVPQLLAERRRGRAGLRVVDQQLADDHGAAARQRRVALAQDLAVLRLAPVVQDHRQQDDVVPRRERRVGEEVAAHRRDAVAQPGLGDLARRDPGHERQVVDRGPQVRVAPAQLDVDGARAAADVQEPPEGGRSPRPRPARGR